MSCDLLADNLPKYLLRSLLVLSRCFIVVTAHYTISDEFRLLSKVSWVALLNELAYLDRTALFPSLSDVIG